MYLSERSAEVYIMADIKEKKKLGKMNEAAWLLGTLLCALGVALCTKAGFGLSMIAAPAYILHIKLYPISAFFTQGTCEYLWQGLLLAIMCIGVQKFRFKYLLGFVTGVIFGLCIDMWLSLLGGGAMVCSMPLRIVCFAVGEFITALAVAFYFRTEYPLQICELTVTEFAARYRIGNDRMKLINDIVMLTVSVVLALILNRKLDGVGIGTVIITAINAPLIGLCGKVLDRFFDFSPRFPRICRVLS